VCQCVKEGIESKLKEKATAAGAKEKKKERRAAAPKTKANKIRSQPPPSPRLLPSLPNTFPCKQASLPLKVSKPAASSDLSPYPLTVPNTEKGAWIQGT